MRKLIIIHCFRTPLGGLFRHVLDVAKWQAEQGHDVGLITGDLDEWPMAREKIADILPLLSLGVHSYPISRVLNQKDLLCLIRARKTIKHLNPDIVHGHGAKGGFYARLSAWNTAKVFYTPHGGSLHYSRDTLGGKLFLGIERFLEKITDGIIFESEYAQQTYEQKIGRSGCPQVVIYNGLSDSEFEPVNNQTAKYDLGFIGELRFLKGIDTLLQAIAHWPDINNQPRCIIIGAGRDEAELKALAIELGVHERVDFVGAMPARQAFTQAKLFVLPSKAESLPYIVLEVLAAKIPAIVTNVGGIKEIYDASKELLIPAEDRELLAGTMHKALIDVNGYKKNLFPVFERVSKIFRSSKMSKSITDFYIHVGK